MKRWLLMMAAAAAFPLSAFAGSVNSITSGNWNSTSTWDTATVPTSADTVSITPGTGVTVPLGYAASANSITIPGDITNPASLSVNSSGASLTVTNGISIQGPTGTGLSNTLNVGQGTLTCASLSIDAGTAGSTSIVQISTGQATVTGNVTFGGTTANAQLTFVNNGSITIGGNLADGGIFTAGVGQVTLNGATDQTLGGYSYNILLISKSGGKVSLTGNAAITTSITMQGGGFTDAGFTITATGANFNQSAGTYTVNASTFPAFNAYSVTGGTITYAGASNQTVSGGPSYQTLRVENLTGAGSPVKTSGALISVVDLVVDKSGSGTVQFDTSSFNLNISGNLTNNSLISGSGSVNLMAAASSVFGSGTFGTSGTVTFGGTTKTIDSAALLTFNSAISVASSTTVTNNGTVIASNTLDGVAAGSTWSQGATGILYVGTSAMNTGVLDASASGNLVNYNAAAAQTVKATTYHHLQLDGSGTKTLTGVSTIAGG